MKKIVSAVMACAMAASLTACTFKSPETVGSLGDTQITGGMYLVSQLSALMDAENLADGAKTAKDVLAAQLTLEDGTTQKGSDFVAAKTMENLQYMAGVDAEFASRGLEMDAVLAAQAKAQADQIWSYSSSLYSENGIGLQTVQKNMETSAKASMVFDDMYADVTDAECRSWLAENAVSGMAISLPMYNLQDYSVSVSDETRDEIRKLAESARKDLEAGKIITDIENDYIAKAYELVGMEYTAGAEGNAGAILMPGDMDMYGADFREAVTALKNGEAAAVDMGSGMLVFCRSDAEDVYDLETIKESYSLLNEMKSEEFYDAMVAAGAALQNKLDSKAMAAYKAANAKL